MSIYKTAACSLLTGILGSGKTLRAVQLMDMAVKDGEKVYQCGFKNISVPGVIDWEDPREWQSLPPGAILFVDEAQKWFGERRSGKAPDYLKAMNTMRGEEGVRMVLLTQHPKYLDAHVKDLIGCHEHLLRESGKSSSKLWRSDEIMEDPRSPRARGKADYEVYKHPAEYFSYYTSANSDHTIKYRMPSVLKKAILIGGTGGLVFLGVWFFMFRSVYDDVDKAKGKAVAAGSGSPTATANGGSASASGGSVRSLTPLEYATAHLPRFPTMPWTAKVYDDRKPTADPQVACMSSEPGEGATGFMEESVTCLTEQGTRYDLSPGEARRLARNGPVYNPYKTTSETHAAPPQAAPEPWPARSPVDAPAAAPGVTLSAPQVAAYGDLAIGKGS
ncbi:zonular occludens toxin family protein [Lysobacter capsici]|uniref:zonular occludens toxin domain-containing protein n=1 Tax=Lysobacter capsici TaxID=435897 RepID=UPI0007166C82|nr:zonular occludens toxin domain-containing protein [Lysobacter capsici]ALN85977.1 zonular occludens toxin family protein [Lysobacter capsici]